MRPLLSKALSVVLPTEEQTWLLRACLWAGAPGRQAWSVWQERVSNPLDLLRQGNNEGVKNVLPLLFTALRDNEVTVDPVFQTCLRTAYLRDELRGGVYRQICQDIVSTLTAAEVPVIVLKGAALADMVYADPILQHSHFLDILIKEEDLFRVANLLSSRGFTPQSGELDPMGKAVEMRHSSGLPLVLHRQLFPIPFSNIAMAEIWERSQSQLIADIPARVLSPTDNLLHVCGQAFYSMSHETLRWVCDSWFLIHRYPKLEWDGLVACAVRSRLALSLSVTLGYLAEALRAPIPVTVLDRLGAAAARATPIEYETALFSVRRTPRGRLWTLLRTSGNWGAGAVIMKCLLFPSPSYLRWVQPIRYSGLLPFYYVYRLLRYIVRRVAWHGNQLFSSDARRCSKVPWFRHTVLARHRRDEASPRSDKFLTPD